MGRGVSDVVKLGTSCPSIPMPGFASPGQAQLCAGLAPPSATASAALLLTQQAPLFPGCLQIQVPPFVQAGDMVVVETAERSFVRRA